MQFNVVPYRGTVAVLSAAEIAETITRNGLVYATLKPGHTVALEPTGNAHEYTVDAMYAHSREWLIENGYI